MRKKEPLGPGESALSVATKKEWLAIILLIVVFSVSLTFVYDLWHTAACSMSLLEGHFRDFYEEAATRNGTIVYYPTIYFLFAIWNLIPSLLGLKWSEIITSNVLFYEKCLGYFFLVIACVAIYKIAVHLYGNQKRARAVILILLTIPYFFLISFPWGIYDPVYIAFVMWGIYFLLVKSDLKFTAFGLLCLALAVSCKTFVFFMILPVLFYRFKKIWQLILAGGTTVSVMGIECIIFRNSQTFQETVLKPMDHFVATIFAFNFIGISFLIVILILTCIWLYRIECNPENFSRFIWGSFLVTSSFIGMSLWNPGWPIMLMPYFALLTVGLPQKDRKLVYLLNMCFAIFAINAVVTTRTPYFGESAFVKSLLGGWLLKSEDLKYGFSLSAEIVEALFTSRIFKSDYNNYCSTAMFALLAHNVWFLNPWRVEKLQEEPTELLLNQDEKKTMYACLLVPLVIYMAPIIAWVTTRI
ncbi:hypothetical protein [Oscillibacter sp.]|uniref:hypothetical protein n=1 Tax=Oscillibacter sp. TaxID=1945593 RepID=UPI00289642A3|nr:hypothetical protein [Oscillibacter sp.]